MRPVKNTEIALSCYPTSCNEHAVAFLAAIDPLSQLVDSSCDLTETPQQPLTVYDSMSARVVVKTTTPNYLYPQEGSSPIVDYKSAWEPVVAWTVNWTLKVVEGQELRMGRSYRLCVDRTGPGGYNGLQLSDVQDMFEVYVAGIRSADSGIMVSNNSKLQVLCEAMGDLYQLGCQTYASYSVSSGAEVVNPGATSAYLAVSCDTSDNDGLRDGTYDNESASSYLMGDGNPYFYLEWDTRDMQLGVHYRLCEDLDGTNSIAGFNWPGIVVYLGGVTSISTVLRDPKDGPVVIAAENQGLLLNCLYGACSSSTEAYLGASCDSSDNSTDRSEWATFTFRGSSEEWQWQLKQWDLTNLTNGTTYKLCTDFDGQDQGPLHSGFSGIMVPVTPITQISEETIQAATDQQVLLVCHGCFHTERYCDAIVGCPATDPIYIVSSAYLSNQECNYSDYDGFQMDEGDWTTMSAPLRPTTNSTRASSLSASPGKDSIVYNTEVIFDASATIIGTRYRLCMDLDGTSTDFSFHDTGFSVYITPVSVVRHQVIIIGETSRVEFSCHGTGSVSTTCSTASAVYLSQRCDLNRNSGVLGDWEIHTNDDTPTVAVTEIPFAEGSAYEFRVDFNTTHLQIGWTYRLCIDTDTAGGLFFGDSGFAVTISGIDSINPLTLDIGSASSLDIYCPVYCSTATRAYLAQQSVGCDSSASDSFDANGEVATGASSLVAATQPATWQVASYFTRDWTVTFDTSGLKPGDSYLLCVDYDGPGALTFANAYDGVLKINPIFAEKPALEAAASVSLPLTCASCNLSTIIYLATACNVDAVISGNKENCQTWWNLVPPQTCSQLLEANFPTNTGFVRLSPRTDGLPGSRWLADLDTSGLTVGVNYRLCADLDGGFTEQGFLDVGQVMITGVQAAQRSISTAATRHEWSGGSNQALVLSCSSYCTTGTTLVYLASTCDSSSDNSVLKTAVAGEQSAPVTLDVLSSWTTELLPQRTVTLHGQDSGTSELFILTSVDATKYIAMLDTSGLTNGQFYKLCVDHDGGGNWFVGDTGLTLLATDLVVDVSIDRGLHQALSINCTSGCSNIMAFLSLRCDEVVLSSSSFSNAYEGTLPSSLSRFGGPRIFSGQDTDNETTDDTPSIITGDTYNLYLDTSVLQLGQTYALCVDYDGYSSTFELGDSGHRVYVTGVFGFGDGGVIFKAQNQMVEIRCTPGECSNSMRVYLGFSCDFTVLDGTASSVSGVQTDAVSLDIAGLEEDADDRGGLAASSTTMEVLEAAPLRQVVVTCSDCSGSSSAFLAISCDSSVLPELTPTAGSQVEVVGFATASVPLSGTAPDFTATLDAGQLLPGALYTICLDKDGVGATHIFQAYGQVQVSSPVPHRYRFTVDASQLAVGNHYKVCLDADGSTSTVGWGDTGLEVYVSGVASISPSVLTRGPTRVLNMTCEPSTCSSTLATTPGGSGRTSAYLSAQGCDRHIYDGILDSFDIDRVLPVSGRIVNVYSLLLTTFSSQFYGTGATKFNTETFFVTFDTSDLLPGYHLSICVDLDGQQVSNAFGPAGKVYISGVRGISTTQISAASSQRIEVTCDADACGAKGALAFLALECTSFQTRHGGVSVGAVDELNHFSSQMLPLGEAESFNESANVSLESADLIRIPASSGQSITFECQDCSTSSSAYLVLDGCDSSVSGSRVALFGKQTASVALVAHWDLSHFTAVLDASPLTPGLHYNFCVDRDGVGTAYTFGDTGVRIFLQGAYTPPVPLYGSLISWYFDADASHLAAGRRYRICTDFDGRLGPLEPGDTDFEVFVSPLQSLEYDSVPKSSAVQIGLSCNGCSASSDTTPPSFDAANSFPAHNSVASRFTNVVLAFSEAVQLAPTGVIQIWDLGIVGAPVFEVAATDIYAANAVAGGSLVRDNKIYITPATLCNVLASCTLFTNTRRYYVVIPEGTVLDLAGNSLAALDTSTTWYFQAMNVNSDTVAPEVLLASHVEVVSSIASGFIIFSEDVTFTATSDLTLLDCGADFDCSTTTALTGGSQSATLTPYVAGTTDLQTIRAQKQEFGMLEYHYEVPNLSPRRYQIQVPVNYVSDTASATPYTGPTSVYTVTFDVGMVEGKQVLPVTSGTQLFLATDCNSSVTETYFWRSVPGQTSPVVQLQSSGSHPFSATFDTNDLTAGVHYEVCIDVDGIAPVHRPGRTGLQIFVSPVTAVSPRTVTQDLSRTITVTCPTVCSSSTFMYLGVDCDAISRPGVVPEMPPFRTRSAPLQATGVTGEWFLTFDASNLTAGLFYHLCLDVDGSSTTRYYGDSRLKVYISPVAGLRLPVIHGDSAAAVLNVACFARPQEAFGWWEENETEALEVTPLVENFTKNYVNQLHWCSELTTAYLASSCDTSVSDGYVAAVSGQGAASQTLTGDTRLVVWQDISLLGDNDRLSLTGVAYDLGYRYDAACANAALQRGYVYWTRRAADNTCWFLTDHAPAYAVDNIGYSSGPVSPQMWLLTLDTRPLLQGEYYVLCIDLDGYQTVSSMAESLLSVYVSPVQDVSTTTVWKGLDQNISLECSNCTTSTKLTLSLKCDGSLVVGEIVGQQSLVVNLQEAGENNMWFALVDAKTLAEGKHYRVCLEMDETAPMGDTGFRIYVSPVYYVTPSVGNQQFQEIEIACPSALCSRSTEIRLAPLHESCGNGNMDKVETTWVTIEGELETQDLKPSRLRGGLDASILTAGRGRGAYFIVVDTRNLEVDQSYRVCLDIDGIAGEEFQPGDAGYVVVKPDTTAPLVFGNGSFNASAINGSEGARRLEESLEDDPIPASWESQEFRVADAESQR